jgi:hypothetical protein
MQDENVGERKKVYDQQTATASLHFTSQSSPKEKASLR